MNGNEDLEEQVKIFLSGSVAVKQMRSVGKQLFICCGKGSNPGEVENMSKELPTETSPRPRECDCT